MTPRIFVFQGDSITDANRDRSNPRHLGYGYVPHIQEAFPNDMVYNRGISGDRTVELLARWDEDCLKLNPDFLCIYVGVNDVWHKHKWNKPMTLSLFEQNYRLLLEAAKRQNPNLKVLLVSPFVFPFGDFQLHWRPDLDGEIAIIDRLAGEYDALHLPLEKILFERAKTIPMKEIADDAIHPTPLGHRMIAEEIRQRIDTLYRQ
jgi:lysophospholipase L1-like esterase